MRLKNSVSGFMRIGLSCLMLALTSCQNGNLFGGRRSPGDTGDNNVLLSDADIALRQRDYSASLALYEKILASDSDNAQALFGAAPSR